MEGSDTVKLGLADPTSKYLRFIDLFDRVISVSYVHAESLRRESAYPLAFW